MNNPQPGTRVVVGEWHPYYAGLQGVVSEAKGDGFVIVRLDECPRYPQGFFAVIGVIHLDHPTPPRTLQEERRHARQ